MSGCVWERDDVGEPNSKDCVRRCLLKIAKTTRPDFIAPSVKLTILLDLALHDSRAKLKWCIVIQSIRHDISVSRNAIRPTFSGRSQVLPCMNILCSHETRLNSSVPVKKTLGLVSRVKLDPTDRQGTRQKKSGSRGLKDSVLSYRLYPVSNDSQEQG